MIHSAFQIYYIPSTSLYVRSINFWEFDIEIST